MTNEIVSEFPHFDTYDELIDWCSKVREGQIKTTLEIRQRAKQLTFAKYYNAGPTTIGRLLR